MSPPEWYEDLQAAVAALPEQVPALVGAAVLLLLGWILALLARRSTRAVALRLVRRIPLSEAGVGGKESDKTDPWPVHASRVAYWTVLLIFAAWAVHVLGLSLPMIVPGLVADHLPSVLIASLTMVIGLLVARLAHRLVTEAARRAGMSAAEALGSIAHAGLVLLAFVIAVEEIGINARLLEVLIALIVGICMAALGLAFGLGAHGTVRNLIAARGLSRSLEVGQTIRMGELTGRVVQITDANVAVEVPEGVARIPAHRFDLEPYVVLGTDE